MSFVYGNAVVVFIALVTCSLAWLYGGTVGSVNLRTVPWLMVLLFEGMLCFPQRHGTETTYMARERVWKSMKCDPLVWITVAFLLILAVPFLNEALCPICDAATIAEGKKAGPLVKSIPFCVNYMHHLDVFLWFLPALTAMLAVRHSLTKSGKRLLLEVIVWNGALLAVLGFVQQVAGAPGPLWDKPLTGSAGHFFSTFGYPNMAGCYFAVVFCLAVGLWIWRVEAVHWEFERSIDSRKVSAHSKFWMKHYLLIPAFLSFFATINTLSRAGILFVTVAAVVLFLHEGVVFLHRIPKAARLKFGASIGLFLVLIAVGASVFMPADLRKEVDTLDSREVLDRVTGRQEWHSRVSLEIFKDNMLFGCGGWGYQHFAPTKMRDKDGFPRRGWNIGSANVHNDYLQFLVEHGAVGFGLLVTIVVLLVIPVGRMWRSMSEAARFQPVEKQPPRPQSFFAFPGAAFATLFAAALPLIHAFGDCPLRSPAVLTLFFVSLAAVGGFLPRHSGKRRRRRKSSRTKESESNPKEGASNAARQRKLR